MIEFEDKAPPGKLSVGDRLVVAGSIIGTACGVGLLLWFVGQAIVKLIAGSR